MRSDRPLRVLEIASGSGQFTVALARAARRAGVALEVTGSDIVPEYVELARELAARQGEDVRFRELDAFALDRLNERYDVVFTANSLHHFTPGQLARVIRGAASISEVFVGVDGRRSAYMLGLVSLGGLASGRWWVAHDAIVSARRFYAESELRLIATMACAGAVEVRPRGRHHTVLTVRGFGADGDDLDGGRSSGTAVSR